MISKQPMSFCIILVLMSMPFAFAESSPRVLTTVTDMPNGTLGVFGKVEGSPVHIIETLSSHEALLLTLTHGPADVSTTASMATLHWITDENTSAVILYGLQADSLNWTKQEETGGVRRTNHTVTLTALDDDTTYYYLINATNANNTSSTASGNFKTKDLTRPAQVTGLREINIEYNTVTLQWNANADSDISHYMVFVGGQNTENSTASELRVTGLRPSSQYTFRVASVDTSGNVGQQSIALILTTLSAPFDVEPPRANRVAHNVTDTAARISFGTDENATGKVYYGTNRTALDHGVPTTSNGTDHYVLITGLTNATTYTYIVEACDVSSNCGNSTSFTFRTADRDTFAPFLDVTLPSIVGSAVISIPALTEPGASLTLSVNGNQTASGTADSNGGFTFQNVALSASNTIVITASDAAGNNISRTFNVSVDLLDPKLVLDPLDDLLDTSDIELSGVVNKNVTLDISIVEGGIDTTPPRQVSGLQAERLTTNRVTFSWEENPEGDVEGYLIYRGDVLMTSTTRNVFTDGALNTDTVYTYRVAAFDRSCAVGVRSEPLTVRTQPGGVNLSVDPRPYNFTCSDTRSSPAQSIDVGPGLFTVNITLNEGRNAIVVTARDISNRTDTKTLNTLVDTEPPEIRDLAPRSGTFIYEVNANSVTIEGITEPNAKVKLYSVRNVFIDVDNTEFQTELKEETTADDDGVFEFKRVNLMSYARGSLEPRQVPAGTEDNAGRYDDTDSTEDINILIEAEDEAGQKGAVNVTYLIGNCFTGDVAYNIIPLPQYQSPGLLSVERLAEGTETISFYFNVTPVGTVDGAETVLEGVDVEDACDDYIKDQKYYNWSCKALRGCREQINPQGNLVYVTCRLGRLSELEEFVGEDWKDFFESLYQNQMRFPIRVSVDYRVEEGQDESLDNLEEDSADESGDDETSRTASGQQYSCEEVAYYIDKSVIDPREVLPDWLLYDGVDFLNKSIDTLGKINDKLRTVLRFTAIGCIGSFAGRFVLQVNRRFVCKYDEVKSAVEGHVASAGISIDDYNTRTQECKSCLGFYVDALGANASGIIGNASLETIQNLVNPDAQFLLETGMQDIIPDQCMDACYPKCAAAWDREASLYSLYRYTCDRVFCHSAPSRWTENKQDAQLVQNFSDTGLACRNDQTVQGSSLIAERCTDIAQQYPDMTRGFTFTLDQKCFNILNTDGSRSIYILRPTRVSPDVKDLYQADQPTQLGAGIPIFVLQGSEDYYLTAQNRTCAEVCGVTDPTNEGNDELFQGLSEQSLFWQNSQSNAAYRCWTTAMCVNAVSEQNLRSQNGSVIDVTSATPRGYTSDCFYSRAPNVPPVLQNPQIVSDDPERQMQCCCLNAQTVQLNQYYTPYDAFIESRIAKVQQPASGSPLQNPFGLVIQGENYSDMVWSYRYWKTEFAGREYNPDRYIKERDMPACFGQNNMFFDLGVDSSSNEPGNLLRMDPFKQHTAALQCACLSGIYNRIIMLQNILGMLRNCLVEVRETGRADGGVCKEVFTQYVCGLIWDVISYVRDGCVPLLGGEFDLSEDSVGQTVRNGVDSVFETLDDQRRELSEEYGNAQLNNLFGLGEGAVAKKICLAAFGFDWELSLDNIIDAAYSTPFATLVSAITSSREYLGFNPRNGVTRFEYRASWLINPGCDLDYYDVSLSCVTREDEAANPDINCDKVRDPAGIDCDCRNLEGEGPEYRFYRGRSVNQNVLVDIDQHDIVQQRYRFDHLKFKLVVDRQITRENPELAAKCFPEGHEDGVFYFPIVDRSPQDLGDCQLDVLSGQFFCGPGDILWDANGTAYFGSVKINGEDAGNTVEIEQGSNLMFQPTVFNQGQLKCLNIVLRKSNGQESEKNIEITHNGSFDFSIPLAQNVELTGGGGATLPELTDCVPEPSEPQDGDNTETPTGRKRICNRIMRERDVGDFRVDLISDPPSARQTLTLKIHYANGDVEITANGDEAGAISYPDTNRITVNGTELEISEIPDDGKLAGEITELTYRVSIRPRTDARKETWRITYGLYHPADAEDPNCDEVLEEPIEYQNDAQEGTATVEITTVRKEEGSLDCDYRDAGKANPKECDCNEDGSISEGNAQIKGSLSVQTDCDGSDFRYCGFVSEVEGYMCAKKQFTPSCIIDGTTENKEACDCNGDHSYTRPLNPQTHSGDNIRYVKGDCDGKTFKYCGGIGPDTKGICAASPLVATP